MSLASHKSGATSFDLTAFNNGGGSDPMRAFTKLKEEFIYVFSGFNDSKLFSCESYDVQRGIWKEIS